MTIFLYSKAMIGFIFRHCVTIFPCICSCKNLSFSVAWRFLSWSRPVFRDFRRENHFRKAVKCLANFAFLRFFDKWPLWWAFISTPIARTKSAILVVFGKSEKWVQGVIFRDFRENFFENFRKILLMIKFFENFRKWPFWANGQKSTCSPGDLEGLTSTRCKSGGARWLPGHWSFLIKNLKILIKFGQNFGCPEDGLQVSGFLVKMGHFLAQKWLILRTTLT